VSKGGSRAVCRVTLRGWVRQREWTCSLR
jgi:hypothetical protein